MTHSLPSADDGPLSEFTGHFKRALFDKSGGCDVTFHLDRDMVNAVVDLTKNDGMALNVTVWGTELDDDARGLLGLMQLLEGDS